MDYMMMSIHDYDMKEEGIQEGLKKGLEEGELSERKKAIINMLKKLSVDEIVELGYDRKLVEELKNEK